MEPQFFAAALQLPHPWPPPFWVELISFEEEPRASLLIKPTGQFVVRMYKDGDIQSTSTFPILDVKGSGRIILSLVVSDAEPPRLNINGRSIPVASEIEDVVVIDTTAAPQMSLYIPQCCHLLPCSEMSAEEQLFLNTLADIEARLITGERYQLLRSSAMLRQLFLDNDPLVHKVNRNYHLKLLFRCRTYPAISPKISNRVTYSFSPEIQINDQDAAPLVPLNKFLKFPCLIRDDEYLATVEDVIKHWAHVMGGVHFGSPETNQEHALNEFNIFVKTYGAEAGLHILAGILRISLLGLLPLANLIVLKHSRQIPDWTEQQRTTGDRPRFPVVISPQQISE